MLSQQTQLQLCELLLQQARVEKQLEVVRQLLCEQVQFIPFSAFQKLDKLGYNSVTAQDLRDFLLDLGFPHSLSETELAIAQYDTDGDLRMNYNQFLRATLTHDDSKLRIITSQRTPHDYIKGSRSIPYDVEYTLAKLFELEIRCQVDLERSKSALSNYRDFSIADCFACIDSFNQKEIQPRDLENFLKRNGFNPYEDEIDSIFRRIDYDNDGIISITDFVKGINSTFTTCSSPLMEQRVHSIQKSPEARSRSPVKGILKQSGTKFGESLRSCSPLKYDIEKYNVQSELLDSQIQNLNSSNQSPYRRRITDTNPMSTLEQYPYQDHQEQISVLGLEQSLHHELEKQEMLKDEERRYRQRQLERSIEKLHGEIKQQEQDIAISRLQRSPGSTMSQSGFQRSPNKHSSTYSLQKNKLHKKLQVEQGKQDILNNSYISQKETVSSIQKYTPKKQVDTSRKPFSPNKIEPSHRSSSKSHIKNNSQMIQRSPMSQSQSKIMRTPGRTNLSNSRLNSSSAAVDGAIHNDKYNKFKASVRGKMAHIRQNTEIVGSQSTGKKAMSMSSQSFRPSSANKSAAKSNAKKKSQQKVPITFTKTSIGFDNSRKKSQQMNSASSTHRKTAQSQVFINSSNKKGSSVKKQIFFNNNEPFSHHNTNSSNIFSSSQKKQMLSSSQKKHQSRRQRFNEELILIVQDIVNFEKKVERNKQDLALRPDFNLMDCFRYVDSQSRGLISSILLEDFLKELKINFAIEDIFLFMRRYDTDSDGKLRFSDFADFITPKQLEYAQILERREASYPDFELSLSDILSAETIKLLRNLFRSQMECEVVMEGLRKKIQQDESFDYHEAFRVLDVNNDGYIAVKDILQFFQANAQVITEREVDFFISRFDKDGDQLVSFGEFVEELSPRTTKMLY